MFRVSKVCKHCKYIQFSLSQPVFNIDNQGITILESIHIMPTIREV